MNTQVYSKKWEEICFLLSENIKETVTEKEFEQQVLRAIEKLGWSEFGGEIKRQVSIQVGRQGILRPDLVIYEGEKALVVIEVKRPQEDISRDDSISQLKSYMRQMKADFGFLVGKEMRIYYDGSLNPQGDPFLIDKILFFKEEKAGSSFVEMFTRENFLSGVYLNILKDKIKRFNLDRESQILKNKLLSADVKNKIIEYLGSEFADYGNDVFESVMAQIKISIEDISDQHQIQPDDGPPIKKPKKRINFTPAPPNSSPSGKTYSLSELESRELDKEYKPRTLIIEGQNIEVKNWTELSTKFVEWLIKKEYLVENNLPIYNFSERDKYFINNVARHKIAEKDGQWKPVVDFFIDTKYNANCHKKNIIYALKYLEIYNADIKISFR